MHNIDRRSLLGAVAGGVLAALAPGTPKAAKAGASPLRVPLGPVSPGVGAPTHLPGDGNRIALTVDDGDA